MSSAEAWTIGRLLQWTTDYLKRNESQSPRLDAEVLLAHSLGCERIQLYTRFTEEPEEETRARFRELVKERAAGKPVAYLVGYREFYSLPFFVTPDVLIPRPETEFVVITTLDLIKAAAATQSSFRIADVGTGSGAIAVTIARHAPQCELWAVDQSPQALEVARRNMEQHEVEDRVHLLEGDLLSPLDANLRLDFVVSNPPYISQPEFEELARDVKDFEPRQALVGGATGTEIIARLVPQAAERLEAGGWLILEISPQIEAAVHQLIAADGRFRPAETVRDLSRLARVVKAQRLA